MIFVKKYFVVNICKKHFQSGLVKLGTANIQKCMIFLLFIIIAVSNHNGDQYSFTFDHGIEKSLSMDEIFKMRAKIMKRSCTFIKQLKSANRIATIGDLKEIHNLLHDLNTPLDVISSKLKPFDKQNLSYQTKFNIDGVGEPRV